LDNCRTVNDQFIIERVQPIRDQKRAEELLTKYPDALQDQRGALILVFDEGSREDFRIIPVSSMEEVVRGGRGDDSRQVKFKGEDLVMNRIEELLGGGSSKKTIYFTQDNGELDLSNDREVTRLDIGMGVLREQLESRKYQIKPLKFAATDPKVPEDAAFVVLARPTTRLPDPVLKALREYMNGDGKLAVFLDVKVDATTGRMVSTGLEPLLRDYQVEVPEERIYTIMGSGGRLSGIAREIRARFNPQLDNPLTKPFEQEVFPLVDVRPVRPVEKQGPSRRGPSYSAQPLIFSVSPSWVETDLVTDPLKIINAIREDQQALEKKFPQVPIPVAVVVTENPIMLPDTGMPAGPVRPRMVVFGDATLLSNRMMSQPGVNEFYLGIVTATFNYLRESAAVGGIEAKQRDIVFIDANTSPNLLLTALLPPALVCLSIVGLGTGLWVVRRR
jgi:hypothetical protein